MYVTLINISHCIITVHIMIYVPKYYNDGKDSLFMQTLNRQMANLNWHDEPELLNPEDYELFQKTLGEWKKFVSGDMSIDGSIVPGEVLDSWIRCKKLGVDPRSNAIKEELSGDKLNELLEDNQNFIEISRPFMKNLYRFVSGSGFVVILCDKSGYLLEIIGDKDVVQFIGKDIGLWAPCVMRPVPATMAWERWWN